MNPLSPFIYYRRHKGQALLLAGLICAGVVGLYVMGGLGHATFIMSLDPNRLGLAKISGCTLPPGDQGAAVAARIRANPDVAQMLPNNGVNLAIHGFAGTRWFVGLIGWREENVATLMAQYGVTLKEGQIVRPRTNGVMLSEEYAAALGLGVGDTIYRPIDPYVYEDIVAPLEVVGILTGDVRLAVASYEHFESHELYRDKVFHGYDVIAQQGRKAAVDDFLMNEIYSPPQVDVWTLHRVEMNVAEEMRILYIFGVPITLIVSLAITLVVGAIHRIALTQRLPEFGILSATGHSKRWLARRLTLETGVLAAVGWLAGIGLAWLILFLLKLAVYTPHGMDLHLMQPVPLLLVTVIPLVVIGFTLASAWRMLGRMDTIAIVERGELGEEQPRLKAASQSMPKPLSSVTFYRRHKSRAVLLVGAMALMIMAVSLLVFVMSASADASQAQQGHLKHLSVVFSQEKTDIDPAITTQIRTYPAVQGVIPAVDFELLEVVVPPFGTSGMETYAVSQEDMATLVNLFGLTLKEGRWPQPRTNEIVVPETFAQNRNLQVGAVLGDPDHPAYPGAEWLPFKLVISGILARPANPEEQTWVSLMSLEYVLSQPENLGTPSTSLLVIPKPGQKDALDTWLESKVAGARLGVQTYRQEMARENQEMRTSLLTIALMEIVIALVAAAALVILNTIFTAQRQAEFGVLYALGFSRLRLIKRTVRETAFTTGIAWGLSALLCMAGLLYLRFFIFDPLGLALNLLNLTPWLFTLPIPLAVLAASTGTIARALFKLDPVAIIERR